MSHLATTRIIHDLSWTEGNISGDRAS